MRSGVLPDCEIEDLCGWYERVGGRWHPERTALIEPFSRDQLQPASYDVRLAPTIRVPHGRNAQPIDLRQPAPDYTDELGIEQGYLLSQGRGILGATVEWVNIPINLVGRIEGKSSLARVFLQIHSAGYLDPGFRGNVTLEIVNLGPDPVLLWPGILIAQLSFEYLSGIPRRHYGETGRYQDSEGAVSSRHGHELTDRPAAAISPA